MEPVYTYDRLTLRVLSGGVGTFDGMKIEELIRTLREMSRGATEDVVLLGPDGRL